MLNARVCKNGYMFVTCWYESDVLGLRFEAAVAESQSGLLVVSIGFCRCAGADVRRKV